MVDDDLWFSALLKTARVVRREPEPLWEVRSLITIPGPKAITA